MVKLGATEKAKEVKGESHLNHAGVARRKRRLEGRLKSSSLRKRHMSRVRLTFWEPASRVEAHLRRSLWPPAAEGSLVYPDFYLTVDLAWREVYVDEDKKLTPIEYALLSLFVQRPGEALSLKYLLTKVWGQYDTPGPVKWHISHLRKKIENSKGDPSPIVTVPEYGYYYENQRSREYQGAPTRIRHWRR